METITGYLIRYHRLKQNLSQEGLCKGICVVSYLSKIEQGKACADPEIIHALWKRLQITYEDDPTFLHQYRQMFHIYFENWLLRIPQDSNVQQIRRQHDKLISSPLCLYVSLFELYETKELDKRKKILQELSEFETYMEEAQSFLYHLAYFDHDVFEEQIDHLKKASRIQACSISYLYLGNCCFVKGSYSESLEYFQKALLLGNEEGMFQISTNALLMIGNCYSNLGVEQLMLRYYKKAMLAARAIQDEHTLKAVYYNLGATYQCWRKNEEAILYLEKAMDEDDPYQCFMIYHKLALAYEELGRIQEGREILHKMEKIYQPDFSKETRLLYEFVCLRYEKDPITNPHYQEVLEDICFKYYPFIHHGIMLQHSQYLIEVYVHQRRYKDAMQLMKLSNKKDFPLDGI